MFGGNNTNFSDIMLKNYIDSIFSKYDTDNSGTLDQDQMTFFFNDLFEKMNIGTKVTPQQSLEAIKSIDQNADGGIDKKELFDAFKLMMNQPGQQSNSQTNPYTPVQHPHPNTASNWNTGGYQNYPPQYYPPPNYPSNYPPNYIPPGGYQQSHQYPYPPPQYPHQYPPYQTPPNQYPYQQTPPPPSYMGNSAGSWGSKKQ